MRLPARIRLSLHPASHLELMLYFRMAGPHGLGYQGGPRLFSIPYLIPHLCLLAPFAEMARQ